MLALYVKVTGDTSLLARAIPLAEVSFFVLVLLVY
jgi:hypothetical protein